MATDLIEIDPLTLLRSPRSRGRSDPAGGCGVPHRRALHPDRRPVQRSGGSQGVSRERTRHPSRVADPCSRRPDGGGTGARNFPPVPIAGAQILAGPADSHHARLAAGSAARHREYRTPRGAAVPRDVASEIIARLNQPIIATSANISGPPTCRTGIEVFGVMDGQCRSGARRRCLRWDRSHHGRHHRSGVAGDQRRRDSREGNRGLSRSCGVTVSTSRDRRSRRNIAPLQTNSPGLQGNAPPRRSPMARPCGASGFCRSCN